MINPDLLQLLRCPFDPARETPLVLEDEHKVFCSRCRVRFPSRDGVINLITTEAVLPDDCSQVNQLPCQRKKPR